MQESLKFLTNKQIRLLSIAVLQPCRGTGASIELVNTFERIVISRGYESYGLSVHNDNYRAIKFYNKMGMTIENRDKKSIYYIIKTNQEL